MRICSPQLGISPHSNLGGTVYDREVLRGLAQLGATLEIPLPKHERHENVAGWHLYPTAKAMRYTYEYNWLFLPRLLKIWRNPGFDLLRIHSPTLAPLGGLFKTLTGRPVVAHYHHLEQDDTIHNALTRAVIHRYDLITTDSHFCRQQLTATYGIPASRIVIAFPGVDAKYQPQPPQSELRRRFAQDNQTVLLYLGVLTARKNVQLLLDVMAQLVPERADLVLVIGGAGPLAQTLQSYVAQKGLQEQVKFAGYIAEADKIAYYNLADVFVFPSRLEGFGMVVAEAMACGIPVVTSNAASLPEVVGEAGLLADPTRVDEFAAQIMRLVQDAALRKQLGEAGRVHVRAHFAWDKTARLTYDCYRELLDSVHKPASVRAP
jgi:glycosyltransferase involved in cell wall biosynthesis